MFTPPPAEQPDRRVVAVTTTGIFCRPGCPAPAPRADHVERMATAREALFAGYRACLRCRPLEADGMAVTPAELRRAERLRPILSAARRGRRHRSGTTAVVVSMLATPLGPVLAGATADGICLLEFTDRPMLPTELLVLERRLGRPIVAGRHEHSDRLQRELDEYFLGERTSFEVPVVAPGSPFQESTWTQLRRIPLGKTLSYEQLAERVGRPGAQRAVGTANGANRVALVIPCHRVVRKNGETGNYGGGRWRKAWLLAHERRMALALLSG
ncbi:MAG TPA: methylated-DNA--[protein]-cysteine S-methyltransferase [Candidatus Dormibacteraeota bacterium]|nr:methylated-DNA--[protein]-cysteine S-methyltransferase [Candidatus Dormibacteraeota bacterium]